MQRQWMILFVVLGITLVVPHKTEEGRKTCIMLVAGAMILFLGLRCWWIGDLIRYYTGFLKDRSLSIFEIYQNQGLRNIGIEICFKIMYALFGTHGYDIFVFIVSLFSVTSISKVIAWFSPSPYYSYLMYISMGLFIFTYTGLKQTIAMGFCCFAMIELLEGTFKRFLIFVLIAGLFHFPALVFLAAWPVSRKKIDPYFYLIILGMIIAIFIMRHRLAFYMEDTYYSTEVAQQLVSSGKLVGGRFIMMVGILVGSTFFRPPNKDDIIYSRVYSVITLAAVFQMFSVYNDNYSRLADYFFQFITLLIPMFLEEYEVNHNDTKRLYGMFTNNKDMYILAGIALTLFSFWFYRNQMANVLNYKFFWEFDAHHWYGV